MKTGIFIIFLYCQLGIIPGGSANYGISEYKVMYYDLSKSYYAEFCIEAQIFNIFFIKGSINNRFNQYPKNSFNFSPDHDEYIFNAGVKIEGFEIGYRHKCYHPIFPYNSYSYPVTSIIEGSFDDLYIKFNAVIKLF